MAGLRLLAPFQPLNFDHLLFGGKSGIAFFADQAHLVAKGGEPGVRYPYADTGGVRPWKSSCGTALLCLSSLNHQSAPQYRLGTGKW